MNRRKFLIGSTAVASFPLSALAKPSTEEGSFECRVITDGNTYSIATGKYRRVGKTVTISIPSLPVHTGITITGLPFIPSARAL